MYNARKGDSHVTTTATTFDALAAARRLEAAGFPRDQAEATAAELRAAAGAGIDRLVTKDDLDVTVAKLESRLVWRLLGGVALPLTIAVSFLKFT